MASAAMIPYRAIGAYGQFKAAPYEKYLKQGMRGAKFVYKHRKAFVDFARKRRKTKHHFDTRNVGQPNDEPMKSHMVTDNTGIKSTRTLYSTEMTAIPRNTTANDIDKRNRQIAFIRGFKICLEVENLSSKPVYLNVAVLAPKCESIASMSADFFRGSKSERSIDFDTTLSSLDFHCMSINTDKFTILKHKKLLFAQYGSTTNDGGTRTAYTVIDMWVPLNRQIRYEDSTNNYSCNPVHLVYWLDKFGTVGGAAAQGGQMTIAEQTTCVFKD